ncbi:hypothetical protein DBR43_03640 [Pedobacter sp. KBW06]|uniref:hypothetical protein n=1 Tax=Pedobacter sp. KBW06 TaxID=2153359 RepID=UPI000F59861F|nr:hypothetical protein [Pedobacter sp. KBW06]RQO74495.1 hypothetical protein DBR43_03640 [Pedobacter sp. KBW06]
MKKIIATLLFSFIHLYVLSQSPKWKIEASIEHLSHDYNWSIAGNIEGNSPNILSELVWQNLKGPKINLNISRAIYNHFELSFNFSQHKIKQGRFKDTDYLQNNRTDAFFKKDGLSNEGKAYNYSLLLKYELPVSRFLKLKPYVGATYFDKKLYMLDFPDELTDPPLNSIYKNQWEGAVLGVETSYQINKVSLILNTVAGYYNYLAEAQWNLNEKFNQPLSFKQTANSYTFLVGFTTSYSLSKHINMLLGMEKKYGATYSGIDEAYLINGVNVKTRFNGAEFNSFGAKIGLEFGF